MTNKADVRKDIESPIIVWVNFGYEGWSPTGYNKIEDAIKHESYGLEKIITRPIKYTVNEVNKARKDRG